VAYRLEGGGEQQEGKRNLRRRKSQRSERKEEKQGRRGKKQLPGTKNNGSRGPWDPRQKKTRGHFGSKEAVRSGKNVDPNVSQGAKKEGKGD